MSTLHSVIGTSSRLDAASQALLTARDDPRYTLKLKAQPPSPNEHRNLQQRQQGNVLWQRVLEELQSNRRETTVERRINLRYMGFRFLDLPGEIRNAIYKLCISEDDRAHGVKCPCQPRKRQSHKPIKKDEERAETAKALEARHKANIEVVKQRRRDGRLTHQAFMSFMDRVWQSELQNTEASEWSHHRRKRAVIQARGDVCRGLPVISQVCRQILRESWGFSYPPSATIVLEVANYDFFPAFRFLSFLQRTNISITGSSVTVRYLDGRFARNNILHRQSAKLAQLILMHRLEGMPLWNCMTGLTESSDIIDSATNGFKHFMYSVRQITPLYTTDRAIWRQLSTKYLKRCHTMVYDDRVPHPKIPETDEELVDTVVDRLVKAMNCRLNCDGDFADDGRDTWRSGMRKRAATEASYAYLHVVNQYRSKVDRVLRSKLGDKYEEWEKAEDEKTMPPDLLY
jgi:hypothetical protein